MGLSSDYILDIVCKKSMFGFRMKDVMLTLDEQKALKIGDKIDLRDDHGQFWKAEVTGNDGKEITAKYVNYGDVGDQCISIISMKDIAKYGSVTNRQVTRPCMQQGVVGNRVFVNY